MRMLTLFLLVSFLTACGKQGEQGKHIGMTIKPFMIGNEKCESITDEYEFSAQHWVHCPNSSRNDSSFIYHYIYH